MDKSMKQLVAEFPAQLKEAMDIAKGFHVDEVPSFNNVLVCGLGGSGIGGTILSQLIASDCPTPINSSKDYTIPAFVDHNTLVIACSYSGNTEETLEALQWAIDKEANIVCVSSGGKLSALAQENNWPIISIPGGYPPRAAFGFSLVQLLRIATVYGLTKTPWEEQVTNAMNHMVENQEQISNQAHQLAEAIQNRIPVIYSSNWLEGVATRWRQQINENAKMLCWHHYYPEMNHNELVGWRNENHDLAVVFLTSGFEHKRNVRRMELTEEVYRKYTPHIHHCAATGDTPMEQALHLIHLGDWMSVHLADLRGADSTEVKVIDWLKGELSKL